MSKHMILGKAVNFNQAADRFCKLQFFVWDAASNASKEFDAWYVECGNIYTVLKNYWTTVESIISKHTCDPLYNTLSTEHQIYNVSQETYRKTCIDLSEASDVYDLAIDVYNEIEDLLQEEREYRELRKASRGEVIGGGFGLGGALKGMATAGAINMATGAAHSIANAFGNASSEGDATERKKELYREARESFRVAIEKCVIATANHHIDVVNSHSNIMIASSFNSDEASALFESAQKVPEKATDLLVDAFTRCPWFHELYPYIFDNYPTERKNIIAVGRVFRCDLSDKVNELLSQEYTEKDKTSESLALEAKKRIKAIMLELGVEESAILDQLESDCLARICPDLSEASERDCNDYMDRIKAYDALERNKQPYIDKINSRIESIWAKEDGDIFDNYLLQLDILNPQEVAKGIQFVKERSRTSDATKYLKALEAFNYKRIKRIRWYRFCARPGIQSFIIKYIGAAIALYGLYQFASEWEWSFWTQILPMLAGIAWEVCIFYDLKPAWALMTIDGKVIHPVFTVSN